jgi:excisionase family DNA binding protein
LTNSLSWAKVTSEPVHAADSGALADPPAAMSTHLLLMLDPWRAASDPPAMSRRLLITKSDAAEQLGVSLRTIERLIAAGRLPLVHVEGAARVRVADLEAYVQGLRPTAHPIHHQPEGALTAGVSGCASRH